MDNKDFNITNYTIMELEDILALSYPYNVDDINSSKQQLCSKVLSDSNIGQEERQNVSNFLNTVSVYLVESMKNGVERTNDKLPTQFTELKNETRESNGHFLITHPSRPNTYDVNAPRGLNVGDDGGAPPGIVNPIKYNTIEKALNVDSKFRPNYYSSSSSDLNLTIPYEFKNVIKMSLASVELPLSYYAVSSEKENNSFVIQYDLSNGEYLSSQLISIPDGNYEVSYFDKTKATPIEDAINQAIEATPLYDPSFNLKYTVDRTSGRSLFMQDTSGGFFPSIPYKIEFGVDSSGVICYNENLPLPMRLGWMLGYRVQSYTVTGINQGVFSEGICYITGPRYIFVAVDDYNNNVNNYYVSAYTDSINNKNILARLNLSPIALQNGIYHSGGGDSLSTEYSRSRNYFGPVNIQKLRITLYDQFGRMINLNNMDWSCALSFECVYD